jgi:hypothetical protein
MPNEGVRKILIRAGWKAGSGDRATCPKCQEKKTVKPPKELTPEQKRAAWCRINSTEKKSQEIEVMAAEPPRKPERSDLRRILDSLDEHYSVEKGMYLKAFNDETIAMKLKVPKSWVSEERERLFGPETNEQKQESSTKLSALEKRCETAMADALKAAEELESIQREVKQIKSSISQAA